MRAGAAKCEVRAQPTRGRRRGVADAIRGRDSTAGAARTVGKSRFVAAAGALAVGAAVALRPHMRIIIVAAIVVLTAWPAAARPRKHARKHAPSTAALHVVPNDRAAQEHARAEAELSDLRAGRVETTEAEAAAPAQTWAVQENDAEVPANLRKK
jgi:hypothetical protein